ncbi:MAG: hypothetical protein QNJ46_13040 [Leptolyngbyaceae cyanobacterium MO_188.B28]|nr:hypothetical protein [Leptolyngbyaceae cyanobacterium MO_188.B28]
MTKLLRHAIAELKKLSVQEQDVIAKKLLAELEDKAQLKDKAKRETQFESTIDEEWDQLVTMIRRTFEWDLP